MTVYNQFIQLYKVLLNIKKDINGGGRVLSDDEMDVYRARVWHYLYRVELLMGKIKSKKYDSMIEDIGVWAWESSYTREAYCNE